MFEIRKRRMVILAFCVLALAVPALGESQSLETLLAYLKSPNASTRRDAASKLGQRREHNQLAVDALAVAASKDEDESVRAEAVRSLGLIKDFSALDVMLSALRDPELIVRRSAVKSLTALYTEHDIDFITNRRAGWNLLNPFLDTDDHEIIEPFVTVDPNIIVALGEVARGDHNRDIRISAIRALGVLRGRDAVPQIADALTADHEIRIDAIRALIKIGDRDAGKYLIPFFRDSDQKVRTQAMVGAGMLKYKPAQEALLSAYGLGPEKRGAVTKVALRIKGRFQYLPPRDEAALWALSIIGDEQAEQVFVDNMTDKDADRRQYGIEGLARIGDAKYSDQISRLVLTEHNNDVKLAEFWALYKMGSKANLQSVVRKLDTDQADQARQYLLEANSSADLYPYVHSSSKAVRLKVIDILGHIGGRESIRELEPVARGSGAQVSDAATLAIKRIEWRTEGRPRASDEVLHRDPDAYRRPRRISNQ
jgi:HEAT repeat protein